LEVRASAKWQTASSRAGTASRREWHNIVPLAKRPTGWPVGSTYHFLRETVNAGSGRRRIRTTARLRDSAMPCLGSAGAPGCNDWSRARGAIQR
jgi:hypothetical protein